MGILGRRRSPKPLEASTDGLKLLQQQLAHPGPVLRLLAEEVLTEALTGQTAASGTVVPLSSVRTIKERGNPSVAPQGQTAKKSPDPKRLRWDHEKRAFVLRRPTCSGNHGRSSLTGEKLTCALCEGRRATPLDAPAPDCRYCGRPSGTDFGNRICSRCEKIRSGFDTALMSRHSIAEQRGRTGPASIGDDELLVTIARRLRDAEQRRQAEDEKDALKARRAKRAATYLEAAD
jgi:hypothetical protein